MIVFIRVLVPPLPCGGTRDGRNGILPLGQDGGGQGIGQGHRWARSKLVVIFVAVFGEGVSLRSPKELTGARDEWKAMSEGGAGPSLEDGPA